MGNSVSPASREVDRIMSNLDVGELQDFDFDAVAAHCQEGYCIRHREQFESWLRRNIAKALESSADKPWFKEVSQKIIEKIPDQIIISEAMRRGLVPSKIRIKT